MPQSVLFPNCYSKLDYLFARQMSTVGYGDITPRSNWGRAVVLCVIISALVVLPPQINRILGLASRRYVLFYFILFYFVLL